MLDQLDQGLREVGEIVAPGTGGVPLAFLHTFGTWLAPAVLSGFPRRASGARFELRQHGEAGLEAEQRGRRHHQRRPRAHWSRLLVEPLRLAGRRRVRLTDVADDTFILLRPGPHTWN